MNEIAKKLAGICVKNKLVAPEMFEWCVYSIEKKNGDILHMGNIDFNWCTPVWISMYLVLYSWISCIAA